MMTKGSIGLVCKGILPTNLKSQIWKMDKEPAKTIHEGKVSAKSKVLQGLS